MSGGEVHFDRLRAQAALGDEVLGAPDYLDRERQLDYALEHVLALHKEVSRMSRANADVSAQAADLVARIETVVNTSTVPQPSRRDRLKSARRRRRAGELTPAAYLRLVGWILVKGRSYVPPLQITAADLASLRAAIPHGRSASEGARAVSGLVDRREYDRAYVMARALMPAHERNKAFLQLHREVHVKRGSLSAVLALTRAIQRVDTNLSEAAVRKVEGRLLEISGWTPRIPGPRVRCAPIDNATVMHLAKESRPYGSNGFTSRSQQNFEAEVLAGLRPVVVTELGFPSETVAPSAPSAPSAPDVEYVGGVEHRRLRMRDSDLGNLPADRWLQAFAQAAYVQLLDIRPAVLHVSSGRRGYETALVALALQEKTGVPLVYEVRSFFEGNWTPDVKWEESGETYERRLAVENLCMDRADVVLTLGTAMRDELVARGVPSEKISLIPNGVTSEMTEQVLHSERLAAEIGTLQYKTFGYVSNMDHYRESQETLIEACAILSRERDDVACVLVGGGPRQGMLEALASRLGLADRVFFVGAVDHAMISQYYGLIDVFVVPRINERAARLVTPLKPFEAMALRRPVVVSDLPALREVVGSDRGLTFVPGDAAHLAQVVRGLFDDPERAAHLAEQGHQWVKSERMWSLNGPRYREAFDRAIAACAQRNDDES